MDKKRIVVIGGGPAGTFFTLNLTQKLPQYHEKYQISIYDGKIFHKTGPKGCNLCAGVLPASLLERFDELGIKLPETLIQSEIKGYILHAHGHAIQLKKPRDAGDIYTIFRGNGPLNYDNVSNISFDDFLLKECSYRGAEIVPSWVRDIERTDSGYLLSIDAEEEKVKADFLVIACGVNSKLLTKLHSLGFGYKPPHCYQAVQAEIYTEDRPLKDFVHSFYRSSGKIRFAAFTPKKDFITVTLVGRTDLRIADLENFLKLDSVRRLIDVDLSQPFVCHCHPKLNVKAARNFVADNLVVIGDAACTRYYKNGIESALITSSMAVDAFLKGSDISTLSTIYMVPAKRTIPNDNYFGRFLFKSFDFFFRFQTTTHVLVKSMEEGEKNWTGRKMMEIMWYTYTGGQ